MQKKAWNKRKTFDVNLAEPSTPFNWLNHEPLIVKLLANSNERTSAIGNGGCVT